MRKKKITIAAEAPETPVSQEKQKLTRIRRRTYISMRLEEITERIRSLATEREQLTGELKTRSDEQGPEVRRLRERRSYIAARITLLRGEQKTLFAERKTVTASEMMELESLRGRGGN